MGAYMFNLTRVYMVEPLVLRVTVGINLSNTSAVEDFVFAHDGKVTTMIIALCKKR